MGISSNNKIADILRQYTRTIIAPKPSRDKSGAAGTKPVEDNVTISEEGKVKMRERFQSDVLSYLRTKY